MLVSRSTVSFIDQNQEKLQAQGTDVTPNIVCITGTKYLKAAESSVKKGTTFKGAFMKTFLRPSIFVGNTNYATKTEAKFHALECNSNQKLHLNGRRHHPRSRNPLTIKIIRLQKKIRSKPVSVLTVLGWVVTGPVKGNGTENVCPFACT